MELSVLAASAVLQGGQAIVPVGDRDDRGGGCDALDGGEGGGVDEGADPFPGQVRRRGDAGSLRYEQALERLEVHGGESDACGAFACDGGGMDYEVDFVVFQRLEAPGRGQQSELDVRRVSEEVAGDFPCQVDIEPLQGACGGIPEAEQVRVLVGSDDQPAACGDGGQRGAGWRRLRSQSGIGSQARQCVAGGGILWDRWNDARGR